ncbi:uncharacterized protein LOC125229597 isoform X2 [Leguminivora glycinivorella]|nr:uncharacterized protein LOC125229597 isoform X2 [Leguminivora glycinivorella]
MERVYEYIDSNMDDAQFTIEELRKVVNVDLPGNRTIKRKLMEHYGENVSVVESKGNQLVFCIMSNAKLTLEEKWYNNKQKDDQMERMRIVCTAANIVLEDIRSPIYETSYYPPPSSFLQKVDDPVPQTLKNFVEIIVTKYKNNPEKSENSVVALCHSMMQAARPRSFKSPLLLGISSIIHHKYASRTLIDLLSSLGFCASYYEVTKFENSVIFHPQTEEEPAFKQFVFDNADCNMQTIDGNHTFHSMGGIQCNTPKDFSKDVPILKLDKIPKAAVIGKYGNVSLQHYLNRGLPGLKKVTLKDYTNEPPILPTKGDALWIFGKSGSFMQDEIPGWNSFMGDFTKVDKEYAVSGIQPLPFINHQPSDLDTVYTALREAQQRSNGLCIVSFDQPLYQKAQKIVKANPEMDNVILRLGDFIC